jgi:hypothetical protein
VIEIMDGLEAKEDLIEEDFREFLQLKDNDQVAAQDIKVSIARVRPKSKAGNFAESTPSTRKRKKLAKSSKKGKSNK